MRGVVKPCAAFGISLLPVIKMYFPNIVKKDLLVIFALFGEAIGFLLYCVIVNVDHVKCTFLYNTF